MEPDCKLGKVDRIPPVNNNTQLKNDKIKPGSFASETLSFINFVNNLESAILGVELIY